MLAAPCLREAVASPSLSRERVREESDHIPESDLAARSPAPALGKLPLWSQRQKHCANLKVTEFAPMPRALSTHPVSPAVESCFGPIWGPELQQLSYLGDGRLKDNIADGLRGRAEHRNHHHKHIRPLGQGILSKVEEDTEAMLIIHCHREKAACVRKAGTGSSQPDST